jgi:hypothetical protein
MAGTPIYECAYCTQDATYTIQFLDAHSYGPRFRRVCDDHAAHPRGIDWSRTKI